MLSAPQPTFPLGGPLTLDSTATTLIDLGGTSPGSTYDPITANGLITLAGALQLNFLLREG